MSQIASRNRALINRQPWKISGEQPILLVCPVLTPDQAAVLESSHLGSFHSDTTIPEYLPFQESHDCTCSNCGMLAQAGDAFCGQCGARF